jgi:hypothetical protein
MFDAFISEQLHANTDAKKRHTFAPYARLKGVNHSGNGRNTLHAMRKSTHARQNNALRARDNIWIGSDGDLIGACCF